LASLPWIVNAGSLAVTVADVAAIGYGFVGLDNTGGFVDNGSSVGAPVAAASATWIMAIPWIIVAAA